MALAARDHIVAGAAIGDVIAGIGRDGVVAVAAIQRVAAGAAVERVSARLAKGQVMAAIAPQRVSRRTAGQGVLPGIAMQLVLAVGAAHHIVAHAAIGGVGAVLAPQHVIARAGREGVIAGAAIQRVGAAEALQQLVAIAPGQDVAERAAVQRLAVAGADNQLCQVGALGGVPGAAPLHRKERVGLVILRVGRAQDDGGESAGFDPRQRRRVETLVLVPEPVAIAQRQELLRHDGLEGLAQEGAGHQPLGQAADPQFDIGHVGICGLKSGQRAGITGDLPEAGEDGQSQRRARFVQRGQAQVAAALDVDGRQILPHARVEQEAAQILDDAGIHRLRLVAAQVAQEAAGPAIDDKAGGIEEEGVAEVELVAHRGARLVAPHRLGRDGGVAPAIGGASEFEGQRGVDGRVVATPVGQGARTQQVGQEFAVGNARDFRRHDGACALVEGLRIQRRVGSGQAVHLQVMLAHEDRLQRGQRGVLLRPHIPRQRPALGEGQVVAGRNRHLAARPAQRGRDRGVRPIHDGAIQPSGVAVEELRRGGDAGAGGHHAAGDQDGAAGGERRVAGGHHDVDMGDAVGRRPGQVMVDELAPGIHHPRQPLVVRDGGIALARDQVGDAARVGAAGQRVNAIGIAGAGNTVEHRAHRVQCGVGQVIARSVDGAEFHALLLPPGGYPHDCSSLQL